MANIRRLVTLTFAFAIIGAAVGIIFLCADAIGGLDVIRAQSEARAMEAQARALEAEADALRERQALLQTTVTSFATLKDSLLVTVTYIGGALALGVLFIIVIVLLLERGKRNGQTHA